MTLKDSFLIWLLRHRRSTYLRLKKLTGLAIGEDDRFLDLHAALLEDGRGIQSLTERYNIWTLVHATNRLAGALAEVGVYRGGSARIICAAKGDSPFYLFDTFEGMPRVNKTTDGVFNAGDFYDTSDADVARYLSSYANVHLHKGFFPDSARGHPPETQTYRFVHLDVDIYESTLDCLRFFHPRMVRGGVILSHDYQRRDAPGVRKAFTEFFADKQEIVIPIWDTQCVVTAL